MRIFVLVGILCLSSVALAQNTTVPPPVESVWRNLSTPNITATTTGSALEVAAWPRVAIQLVVGTCAGTHSTKFQGTIDGTTWDDIEISGGSAAITQAEVGANATNTYAIPPGFRYVRGVSTISSCTVAGFLSRNP